MVFSFFKKDPKVARPPAKGNGARLSGGRGAQQSPKLLGRALPSPVNRSLNATSSPTSRFATTENAIPDRDLQRTLALQTAAKIDAIESEMARDFLRPQDRRFKDSAANSAAMPQVEVMADALAATVPIAAAAAQPVERDTRPLADGDDGLGGHGDGYYSNAEAIELSQATMASIIDETAILFSNGQPDVAEISLRAAIEEDLLGEVTETAWLMLFELVRQRGDKAGFEQLTMQYALRFENSAPGWFDYASGAVQRLDVKAGAPVVRLPQVIDANIVRPLEELKLQAVQHTSLSLDASATRAIDLVGAELLLRVISAFKRATHELVVLGAENLITPLRAAIEPGRRDASDAAWMLLLEVHRLLNRQSDFEEIGIQYCITFEVSPPSWEPAPPNLKTRSAAASVAVGVIDSGPSDPLDWRGEILADGEPWFGRLMLASRSSNRLAVECAQLRRMSFSAASVLLSVVIKLQQGGAAVEFRNVNYLVASLLRLMGVSAVADLQTRRN